MNNVETENYAYTLKSCIGLYPKDAMLEDPKFKEQVLDVAESNLSIIFFDYDKEDHETYLGLNERRLGEIVQLKLGYLTTYFNEDINAQTNLRNLIPEADIRHIVTIGCLKEIATCQTYIDMLELTGKALPYNELSLIISTPNRDNNTSDGLPSLTKKFGNDIDAYKNHAETLRQIVKRIHSKAKSRGSLESSSMA